MVHVKLAGDRKSNEENDMERTPNDRPLHLSEREKT